ncbi:urea amidolyase [Thioclava marina]|uniref:Urea amidolyase n=1 Tax=Thioclava marina TaxID=1915077 RepID=A0ABX3MIE7_9RHOB|nr:biotin-dependent carboxyltransferase family protein [Thioclava marina]OOY10988.1 urea amidolyase [Thioclava marina]
MSALRVLRADGLISVQDMGREGYLSQGLSRGGAMDRLALLEAAALLGAETPLAGLEMAGAGGLFEVTRPMRIALTGAPMRADLDGVALRWNAAHPVLPGQQLRIGGAQAGSYGYLVPGGEFATPGWLGSRAAHLSVGIGARVESGLTFPCADDPAPDRPARGLPATQRFDGGTVRVADGPQTALFDPAVIASFYETGFVRAPRGNRQGVQLDAETRFAAQGAAGLASDVIGPGDVQMTGDGVPYVLLAECQTIGGYPRIGKVIPADLPIVAQAPPGARLRFSRLSPDQADALWRSEAEQLRTLRAACHPLIRDPSEMGDLLSYQLIGGVTSGDDLERG